MYPMTLDPNRQDNIPSQTTFQFHMHQLCCPCTNFIYPCYPLGYRPPVLTQLSPLNRPSYLHHYQFTQLHLNPAYNIPLANPTNSHIQANMNATPSSTIDLAFGPPPRDRRIMENQELEETRQGNERIKIECREPFLQYSTLSSSIDGAYNQNISSQMLSNDIMDVSASHIASMSTENYITYLVNGCVIGERIAKRNEHRPCFKNIQNLCNRTRSEVVKPNITVSNIHSQGMPWATKDFIFAFVRAINCWCILRGYLGCREGNLGKIDREITPEFRACYNKWEKCTKQLTYYLIETFCRLDEANSSSNVNVNMHSQFNNTIVLGEASTTTISLGKSKSESLQDISRDLSTQFTQTLTQCNQNTDKANSNKDSSSGLKGIPGILHIPRSNSSVELIEVNQSVENHEISLPGEDSDYGSRRIYMKPGSYNVPTKQLSSQSNSPRSIEFLETAQNVKIHRQKQVSEKLDRTVSEFIRDKMWRTAQSVTPEFIRLNEETPPMATLNGIEKLGNVSTATNQNTQIEDWLNSDHNQFDCSILNGEQEQNKTSADILHSPSTTAESDNQLLCLDKPVMVLRRSQHDHSENQNSYSCAYSGNKDLKLASNFNKKNSNDVGVLQYFQSLFKQKIPDDSLENKLSILNDSGKLKLLKILRELEKTEFILQLNEVSSCSQYEDYKKSKSKSLSTVYEKLKNSSYLHINEFIDDIRQIIEHLNIQYLDVRHLIQLDAFKKKFEELILQEFPNIDFKKANSFTFLKLKEIKNQNKDHPLEDSGNN